MALLPCAGEPGLYDAVLFDDTPGPARNQAMHRAAALCSTCPAPCPQKVTAGTVPVELVLLEPDWLPPAREGVAEPELPKFGPRPRQPARVVGFEYVRTDQRVTAWARMAAEQAALGRSTAVIALDLCVDETTAAELIRLHHAQTNAA